MLSNRQLNPNNGMINILTKKLGEHAEHPNLAYKQLYIGHVALNKEMRPDLDVTLVPCGI